MINKIIGSGLFSGYIPFASGTFGSLVAVIIYLIPGFENYYIIIPSIVILFVLGIHIGNYFEKLYGKDPNEFTLDEIVGTWITFLIIPKELFYIIFAFCIWRFLDIVKPFPAKNAESLKGGLGIMLDDVVSAMYSLIIIYIFMVLL